MIKLIIWDESKWRQGTDNKPTTTALSTPDANIVHFKSRKNCLKQVSSGQLIFTNGDRITHYTHRGPTRGNETRKTNATGKYNRHIVIVITFMFLILAANSGNQH